MSSIWCQVEIAEHIPLGTEVRVEIFREGEGKAILEAPWQGVPASRSLCVEIVLQSKLEPARQALLKDCEVLGAVLWVTGARAEFKQAAPGQHSFHAITLHDDLEGAKGSPDHFAMCPTPIKTPPKAHFYIDMLGKIYEGIPLEQRQGIDPFYKNGVLAIVLMGVATGKSTQPQFGAPNVQGTSKQAESLQKLIKSIQTHLPGITSLGTAHNQNEFQKIQPWTNLQAGVIRDSFGLKKPFTPQEIVSKEVGDKGGKYYAKVCLREDAQVFQSDLYDPNPVKKKASGKRKKKAASSPVEFSDVLLKSPVRANVGPVSMEPSPRTLLKSFEEDMKSMNFISIVKASLEKFKHYSFLKGKTWTATDYESWEKLIKLKLASISPVESSGGNWQARSQGSGFWGVAQLGIEARELYGRGKLINTDFKMFCGSTDEAKRIQVECAFELFLEKIGNVLSHRRNVQSILSKPELWEKLTESEEFKYMNILFLHLKKTIRLEYALNPTNPSLLVTSLKTEKIKSSKILNNGKIDLGKKYTELVLDFNKNKKQGDKLVNVLVQPTILWCGVEDHFTQPKLKGLFNWVCYSWNTLSGFDGHLTPSFLYGDAADYNAKILCQRWGWDASLLEFGVIQ
jgi:hypothetical protein